MTLLDRAVAVLKTALDATASKLVTYTRGVHAIEGLKAIPGNSDFEQYTTEEYVGTSRAFDWIVGSDDIVIEGVKVPPEKGDEISVVLNSGLVAVYQVNPVGGSRPYDVRDQTGTLYRVHTKLDRIETP